MWSLSDIWLISSLLYVFFTLRGLGTDYIGYILILGSYDCQGICTLRSWIWNFRNQVYFGRIHHQGVLVCCHYSHQSSYTGQLVSALFPRRSIADCVATNHRIRIISRQRRTVSPLCLRNRKCRWTLVSAI